MEEIKLSQKIGNCISIKPSNYSYSVCNYTNDFIYKEEKKEGYEMIESLNLLKLYEDKKVKKIKESYKTKIDKIRNENSLKEKFTEIIKNAEDELRKLYFSQFTEEQKQKYDDGYDIDQSNFSIKTEVGIFLETPMYVSNSFVNDEIEELYKNQEDELQKFYELMSVIKAHVGIAKTKEEVEEILKRYDVLDGKGKMVTK